MMQAGKYYVGDLCYVLSHEDWDQVCSLTIKDNECTSGEFTLKDGRQFAMYTTKWGDGTYNDQYGNQYSVDSGSIGCILEEDITKPDWNRDLGAVINFGTDFVTDGIEAASSTRSATLSTTSIIQFGRVVIETAIEYA